MSQLLRSFGFIILLTGVVIIPGCGKDKTTQPAVNHAPNAPFNPSPAHGAIGIGVSGVTLRWHCSDPESDTIKYDIYFDTLTNPSLVASNQLDSTYQLGSLEVSREYYWKIVARDEHDSVTASPIWHFSTIPGPEQIIFESDRGQAHHVFMMNADGSNVRNITTAFGIGGNASFSNDGSKIVYLYSNPIMDVHVYTVNCNGTGQFEVTHVNMLYGPPIWSPDMTKIAFPVFIDSLNYGAAIYIVDADGGNLHAITDFIIPEEGGIISWSPDGTRIAFEGDTLSAYHHSICVINIDGTNRRQLTSNDTYDIEPAWSHDGSKIAFSRDENDIRYQIYVMNSDGSDQHNVTNSTSGEYEPCWSPNDSQIAFVSHRDDNAEIYIMNADGSNQHNITNNPASDHAPSWALYHK